MVHIFIAVLGFLVLLLLLTEEFRDALKRVWHRLTSRPVGKYAAYPLAVALGLTAAGLIFLALWFFLSTTFSYD